MTCALPSSPSCKTVQIPNNVAICVKPVNNISNSRGKTWTLNALDLCMYKGEHWVLVMCLYFEGTCEIDGYNLNHTKIILLKKTWGHAVCKFLMEFQVLHIVIAFGNNLWFFIHFYFISFCYEHCKGEYCIYNNNYYHDNYLSGIYLWSFWLCSW